MRGWNLNAILAALCLFWAAAVSVAILYLGSLRGPKHDLTKCPLCDRPVLMPRDKPQLHPDTP